MSGSRWDDFGDLLTVPQVAKILQVARSTAYLMADDGRIPTVRLGKRVVRVPKERLREQIEGRESA